VGAAVVAAGEVAGTAGEVAGAAVVAAGEVAGAGVVTPGVLPGAGVVTPGVLPGAGVVAVVVVFFVVVGAGVVGVVDAGGEVAALLVLTPTVVAQASAEAEANGSKTVTTGTAKPIAAIRLRNPRRSCAPAPSGGSCPCSSAWLPRPSVAIAESYHGRATLFARERPAPARSWRLLLSGRAS